jgi:hypothetical protein
MEQFIWKVVVAGRRGVSTTSVYDLTQFTINVVAETRAQAKAAALAYVVAKAPHLDEFGPAKFLSSHRVGEIATGPGFPRRANGEVVGFEVGFAGR